MLAFGNFPERYQYRISCHSGDGPDIELVGYGKPPRNEKEMYQVILKMSNHASFCLSGDNTLNATIGAIKSVKDEDADDYFVLVLSDANLAQYNISTESISKALTIDATVNSYMIFIGSIQDQAELIMRSAPKHTYSCLQTRDLSRILKDILTRSLEA